MPILHLGREPEVPPPALAEPGVVGEGGSTATEIDGHLVNLTGQVSLDGPALAEDVERGHPEAVQAVIMHELGHLVGLDHVDDPTELMAPVNTGQYRFGPGDRQGLADLGSGPCIAEL